MVFSWGKDSKKQGLLGMDDLYDVKTPTLNKGLTSIKTIDISMSEEHGAAISTNKYLYTWGNGSYGQLGNKNLKVSLVPKKVTLNIPFTVLKVECGKNYTCGITISRKAFIFGKLERLLDQYEIEDNLRKDKDITFISLDDGLYRAEEVYVGEKLFAITSSNGRLYLYIEPHGLYLVKLDHRIYNVKFINDNFYVINTNNDIIYEFIHYSSKNKQFDINDYAELSYSINNNTKLSLIRSPFYIRVLFFTMYCTDEDKEMFANNKAKMFMKSNTKNNSNKNDNTNEKMTHLNERKAPDTISVLNYNQTNKNKIDKISTMLGNIFEKQIEIIANNNKSFYSKYNEDNSHFFFSKKRIELIKVTNQNYDRNLFTETNNQDKLTDYYNIKTQQSNFGLINKNNLNEEINGKENNDLNEREDIIYFLNNVSIQEEDKDSYKQPSLEKNKKKQVRDNIFNHKQGIKISVGKGNNNAESDNENKEECAIDCLSDGNKEKYKQKRNKFYTLNIRKSNKMPHENINKQESELIELMKNIQKTKPLKVIDLNNSNKEIISVCSSSKNLKSKSFKSKIKEMTNEIQNHLKIESVKQNDIDKEIKPTMRQYVNKETNSIEEDKATDKLNMINGSNENNIENRQMQKEDNSYKLFNTELRINDYGKSRSPKNILDKNEDIYYSFNNCNANCKIENSVELNENKINEDEINQIVDIIMAVKNKYHISLINEFFSNINSYIYERKEQKLKLSDKNQNNKAKEIIPISSNVFSKDNQISSEIEEEENNKNENNSIVKSDEQLNNAIIYKKPLNSIMNYNTIQKNILSNEVDNNSSTFYNQNTAKEVITNQTVKDNLAKQNYNYHQQLYIETKPQEAPIKIIEKDLNSLNVVQTIKEKIGKKTNNDIKAEQDQDDPMLKQQNKCETIKVPKHSVLSKTFEVLNMVNPNLPQTAIKKEDAILIMENTVIEDRFIKHRETEKKVINNANYSNQNNKDDKALLNQVKIEEASDILKFQQSKNVNLSSIEQKEIKKEVISDNSNQIKFDITNNNNTNNDELTTKDKITKISNDNHSNNIVRVQESNEELEMRNTAIKTNYNCYNNVFDNIIQDNTEKIMKLNKTQTETLEVKQAKVIYPILTPQDETVKQKIVKDNKSLKENTNNTRDNEKTGNLNNTTNGFKLNANIEVNTSIKDNINKETNHIKEKENIFNINQNLKNENKEIQQNDENIHEITCKMNAIDDKENNKELIKEGKKEIIENIPEENLYQFISEHNSKELIYKSQSNKLFSHLKTNTNANVNSNTISTHQESNKNKPSSSVTLETKKCRGLRESIESISKDNGNSVNSGISESLIDLINEIKKKPKKNTATDKDNIQALNQQNRKEDNNNSNKQYPHIDIPNILQKQNEKSLNNYALYIGGNHSKTKSFEKINLNNEGNKITIFHQTIPKEPHAFNKQIELSQTLTQGESLSSRQTKPKLDWYYMKAKEFSLLKPSIITTLENKNKIFNTESNSKGIQSNQTNDKCIVQSNMPNQPTNGGSKANLTESNVASIAYNQEEKSLKDTGKNTIIKKNDSYHSLNSPYSLKKCRKQLTDDKISDEIKENTKQKTPFQSYQDNSEINNYSNNLIEVSKTNSKITFKNQLQSNLSSGEVNSNSLRNNDLKEEDNQLKFSIKNNTEKNLFQMNNNHEDNIEIKSINSVNSYHEPYSPTKSDNDNDEDEEEKVIAISTDKMGNKNVIQIQKDNNSLLETVKEDESIDNQMEDINNIDEGFTKQIIYSNMKELESPTNKQITSYKCEDMIGSKRTDDNNLNLTEFEYKVKQDKFKESDNENDVIKKQNEAVANNSKETEIKVNNKTQNPRVIVVKSKEELLQKLQSDEYQDEESVYYLLEGEENLTDIIEEEESFVESQTTMKNNSQIIKVKNNKVIAISPQQHCSQSKIEKNKLTIGKKKKSNLLLNSDKDSDIDRAETNRRNDKNNKYDNEELQIINISFEQKSKMEINNIMTSSDKKNQLKSFNSTSSIVKNKKQFNPISFYPKEVNKPIKTSANKLSKMSHILNPSIMSKTLDSHTQSLSQFNKYQKNRKLYKKAKTSKNSISTQKNKIINHIEKSRAQNHNNNLNNNNQCMNSVSSVKEPMEIKANTYNKNNSINPNAKLFKAFQPIISKANTTSTSKKNYNYSNKDKANGFESPKNTKKNDINFQHQNVVHSNIKENLLQYHKDPQNQLTNKNEIINYQTPTFNKINKNKCYTNIQKPDNEINNNNEPNEIKSRQNEFNKAINKNIEEDDYFLLKSKYNAFLTKTFGNDNNTIKTTEKDDEFLHDLAQNKIPIEEENFESIKCSSNMKEFIIHSLENFKFKEVKEKLDLMKENSEGNQDLTKSNLLNLIALDEEEDKSNMLEPIELDRSWISITIRKSFVESLRSSTNIEKPLFAPDLSSHPSIKTVKVELYQSNKKSRK